MPRGSKAKYTDKQKRKAEHIEDSYEAKGVPKEKAEARAWATVNKQSGGGERKGGSGRTTSEQEKKHARQSSAKQAASSRAGKARPGNKLADMKKTELLELARKRDISGRSSMRKEQLLEALRKAA